jgi:hypothetical protein
LALRVISVLGGYRGYRPCTLFAAPTRDNLAINRSPSTASAFYGNLNVLQNISVREKPDLNT